MANGHSGISLIFLVKSQTWSMILECQDFIHQEFEEQIQSVQMSEVGFCEKGYKQFISYLL